MSIDRKSITAAADTMVSHRPTVVLTGAGISVESGIPDFRSATGLWERYNPSEYATLEAFTSNPKKVWNMLRELEETLDKASPNNGHTALAQLEKMGVVSAIVTQNIDNLHQEAGSRRVIEFHGNGRRLSCLSCGAAFSHDEAAGKVDENGIPLCSSCSKILKPDVIFFGETIPEGALTDSYELAAQCGVMLVVGTSATVMPAAALPIIAKRSGAFIIEVNIETTELTPMVDMALLGPSGLVLPALTDAVGKRLAN